MLKLLLLMLAIWLIFAILKRHRHQTYTPPSVKTGNMVQCAVCSVHLPESEAISAQGRHYCCEAHFLQRQPR